MRVFFIIVALVLLVVPAFGQMPPAQVIQQMQASQLNSLPPAVQMTELNRRAMMDYSKRINELRMNRELSPAEKYSKAMQMRRDYYNELYDNGDAYLKAVGGQPNIRPAWLQAGKKPSAPQGLLQRIMGK